jgi:flagellar motor protein MotB
MNHIFKKNEGEELNPWVSYTDLMTGFFVIFIVIAIISYDKFEIMNQKSKEIVSKGDLTNINEDFKNVFESNNIVKVIFVDENDIKSIRFYPPENEFFFKSGQDQMESNLKEYILKHGKPFVEKAMHLKYNEHKNIQEIRIEGHTDSNPIGVTEPFMGNLSLSTKRAYTVYEYIHDSCGLTLEQKEFVEKYMISVGYSFAHRLPSNVNENPDLSRRIEFRIISK